MSHSNMQTQQEQQMGQASEQQVRESRAKTIVQVTIFALLFAVGIVTLAVAQYTLQPDGNTILTCVLITMGTTFALSCLIALLEKLTLQEGEQWMLDLRVVKVQ